ncbi:hypothetical protein TIFTF001_009919 [Ficus carica]|uniref:Uncharacterized protein n=1 Tax=Ficus carica TaxID=3494 RepID=A0AA87ZVJ6_FICCA|nr:hypothetical protein TIFTF001_009919 [Ficus carica]
MREEDLMLHNAGGPRGNGLRRRMRNCVTLEVLAQRRSLQMDKRTLRDLTEDPPGDSTSRRRI